MTTYVEDIGGGRQRELGPADDEGDGGQALHGVAGNHELGDRKGKAVERPLEPRRRASPLFLCDSVPDSLRARTTGLTPVQCWPDPLSSGILSGISALRLGLYPYGYKELGSFHNHF